MVRKLLRLTALILLSILVLYFISLGDWHLKRNRYNILPEGMLLQKKDSLYIDEQQIEWILQPNNMNIFHQPENIPSSAPPIPIPYPNMDPPPTFDPYHPNLKLLSLDGDGGSYEAILQADGEYLIEGKKQGTYNYANPSGFFGFAKHALFDVVPHFFSSNYDDDLNRPNIQSDIKN